MSQLLMLCGGIPRGASQLGVDVVSLKDRQWWIVRGLLPAAEEQPVWEVRIDALVSEARFAIMMNQSRLQETSLGAFLECCRETATRCALVYDDGRVSWRCVAHRNWSRFLDSIESQLRDASLAGVNVVFLRGGDARVVFGNPAERV